MNRSTLILYCYWFAFHFLIGFSGYGQDSNFLSKYSYPCISLGPQGNSSYTCFFYKSKTKKYLVSNYHTFTGINPFTGNQERVIDTLFVGYPIGTIFKIWAVPIKIKEIKSRFFYESPDIFALEITPPEGFQLNYINETIDTSYLDQIPLELLSYGYPGHLQSWERMQQGLFKGKYDDGARYLKKVNSVNPTPSEKKLAVAMEFAKKTTFYIPNAGAPGTSGSPVFGRFSIMIDDRPKDVFKFSGVVFAGSFNKQVYTVAIKGKTVYEYLKSLR